MRPSRVSATRVAAAKATTMRSTPVPSAGQRTLLGAGDEVCPQPTHASQPPVVVLGFAPEVFRDFRVRKNQESLVSDALDHNVGDLLGLEGAGGQEVSAEQTALSGEHVSPHALRAQARLTNAVVAMGDGQPLEELERRSLRHP